MQIITTLDELRACVAAHRQSTSSASVAFVPTMGSLHEGHLCLIDRARQEVDQAGARGLVIASIFVNPLQFAPHEDFGSYPRDLAKDAELLQGRNCDVVFAPSVSVMYPQPQVFRIQTPAGLSTTLEGEFRPGFFEGVCTVVLKLFNMAQPDVAVFGRKDFQQCLMIEHMTRQLALPLRIVAADTVRADDGLALSSRNAYLSLDERQQAVLLNQTLLQLAKTLSWTEVVAPPELTERIQQAQASAVQTLQADGWVVDYVQVRAVNDFLAPSHINPRDSWVVLAAAKLGRTRLIDNHVWMPLQG